LLLLLFRILVAAAPLMCKNKKNDNACRIEK
jgi:hypothetical protein